MTPAANKLRVHQGIDLTSISRIAAMVEKHGESFINRIYTQSEIDYAMKAKKSAQRFAGRFAAKEAILKLFGTGLRGKLKWTDMEILNDQLGAPSVKLSGEALVKTTEMGISEITISITHDKDFAIASAVAIAITPTANCLDTSD